MIIRPFRNGDERTLLGVYHTAIRQIAIRDYTLEQVQAWAPDKVDFDAWCVRLKKINPFVAELDGVVVGYADIQSNGYVDHFFVSGDYPGRGIGKALMSYLIKEATFRGLSEMTSDVSMTAQEFFKKFGFQVIEHKDVTIRGVVLRNARMRKVL